MTFGEMKSKVADWLNRTDLSSVTGDFVNMAIKRAERERNFNYMLASATGTLTTDSITAPTRYKETKALVLAVSGQEYNLIKDSYEHMKSVYNTVSATERPREFAYLPSSSVLMVRPYPDSASVYTYDLLYFAYSSEMTSDASTHWLLTNAWEVVLYGALLEADMYIMDDARMAVIDSKYQQFMKLLVDAEKKEEFSGYQTAKSAYMGG